MHYHSPYKFRHGHTQSAQALSKTIADYKAISLNLLHSSMEITDQFYSNINDGEVQSRISGLNKQDQSFEDEEIQNYRQYLEGKRG